ncbi:porin [Paraburkholderia solisilvae]|nr:porin [Paraburkholderia solisilvae]
MKKVLVLAASSVAATSVFAQSMVTLYGTMDDSFAYSSNQSGQHDYQMSQGGLGSSKWGLLIKEDLGSGYSAVARMENGFDANSGKLNNNGRLFGRQTYVGLSGPFGSVLLGRQYDLVADALLFASSSLKFAGIWGAHVNDVDNIWCSYSLSNSIKYLSPTFAGFRASALFSFGGVPGDFSSGKKESVSLSYNYQSFDSSVVFSRINNPATSIYDATAQPVSGGSFANTITVPAFSGYASAQKLQVIGAALNYKFWGASIGAEYTNTRFQDVVRTSSTPFAGTATFNTFDLNATYLITPTVQVGAGYTYSKAETARYGQLNLGAQYYLSKQTLLYLVGAWQHATGTDSTGKTAVAQIYGLSPSSTSNQLGLRVGIRHNF